MKKLTTLLLVALLPLWGLGGFAQEKLSKEEKARREKNIQAGNPFARFGYKAKVATLSKGKYLEFHDLDSIVVIGTVRWHVNKNQIVGRIVQDSLNPDAQPIGDRAGRWISPDPLSEEFPSWSPYNMCLNSPVNMVDPDGRAASPIFDSSTGKYLGNDSQGFLNGEVLFMDKDKFNNLSKTSEKGIINHDLAVKNSTSISQLNNTTESLLLFNKASEFIDKTLYKYFYGVDLNKSGELFNNTVETTSPKLGKGTENAKPIGTEYGNFTNVAGNTELITNNFDLRNELNTAPNIFSNFVHEFRGHGGREAFNIGLPRSNSKFPHLEHQEIYKIQATNSIFKFTTGAYRQHILDSNKAYGN